MVNFSAGPNTAEVLSRPFFDTALGTENARLVSLAGQFDGNISAEFSTLFFLVTVAGLGSWWAVGTIASMREETRDWPEARGR